MERGLKPCQSNTIANSDWLNKFSIPFFFFERSQSDTAQVFSRGIYPSTTPCSYSLVIGFDDVLF